MEFEKVKLIGKANIYFGGKVNSRKFYMSDTGDCKTLGFMLAGEYEFSTGVAEKMQVLQGEMEVQLPGEGGFTKYGEGASFRVPAKSAFKVKVAEYADYCCSYLA